MASDCNTKFALGMILGVLGGFIVFTALSNRANINEEEWEVQRDDHGLATSVNVHRKVR